MSSFTHTIRKFPRIFWVSNIMELFERWAWYGFYNALALYLTLSKDTGALGFSQAQKGLIIGTGSMLLYVLPLITGAIADRIGYKKILILSFTMYVSGYLMMGAFESYQAIFFAYIYLAVGGALFKPIISAMIAKTTDKKTSSLGFGIFYMMINIGGFIGPFISGLVYNISWNYVFLMSIITIGINYIFVFFFFKEPKREESNVSSWKNILEAFKNIYITLLDYKYVLFLLIMAGFWTAFNQLYYSFPVFLNDWVDLDALSVSLGFKAGAITPITITSLDAFFIILFQLLISSVTMKFKPLNVMITGIIILSAGLFFMFTTRFSWLMIFGILVFSIGEMVSSPKYTEYVGRIAPMNKKALYMGTSFLPLGLGHWFAGILSGNLYANISEKFTLLKKEVAIQGLDIRAVSDTFTQNDYMNRAEELMGLNNKQLTQYLWDQYHPMNIWMIFSGIALGTAILLFIYNMFILNSKTK
ncbi:MAG: MFS transporter [Bacteroidetes bacterium]|nr:MFS transporter [Bacteroidota bacterium]